MFKFIFGRKKEQNKKEQIINNFINEHKILVELYVEILELADKLEFSKLKEKLKKFEEILLKHINDEREEIYEHLNKVLDPAKDAILLQEINKIKADIVPIKKKINVINLKYREFNEENIKNFIDAFSYLKEPILNRIELEEKKLFALFNKKAKR